jgi:hypothetical protein
VQKEGRKEGRQEGRRGVDKDEGIFLIESQRQFVIFLFGRAREHDAPRACAARRNISAAGHWNDAGCCVLAKV